MTLTGRDLVTSGVVPTWTKGGICIPIPWDKIVMPSLHFFNPTPLHFRILYMQLVCLYILRVVLARVAC